MYGSLAAEVKRRTRSLAASLAAAVAVLAAVLTAGLAGPARASAAEPAGSGRVSVTINSMNPQYAVPGATVNLTGTVSNGTRQTQAGLQVQLYTSATRFTSRDQMEAYLSRGVDTVLIPAGRVFILPASVAPGATAPWSASFQVSTQGISQFGVYAVAAQLLDSSGGVVGSDQTLLPFWPGQRTASLQRPLNVAWLWPLIDQPHRQVCSTALTNNDLAASLGSGGRLATLLTAGVEHADADLTWVIDPALLSDVATMAHPYQAGGEPSCAGAPSKPANAAAIRWLTALKRVTPDQPTVITPYANVDMAALVHQGLTADLATAFRTGDAVADSVLGGKPGHAIAVPPGGTADLSVLTNLATAEHVDTVVLNSGEMPPVSTTSFSPDDAITSVRTEAGTKMSVLLADGTLTGVLAAGDTSTGELPQSTEFAVKQQFLAETAMIAAEAPDTARSIVVAPPDNWSPSQALAGDLLGETGTRSAPWLKAATLGSLSSAPDSERALSRQPPSGGRQSSGELSRGYLTKVRTLGGRIGVFKSMLYRASPSYLQSFNEALAATESVAWRRDGRPQGQKLIANLNGYLKNAESKVRIITSAQVPMGGASGAVPVSIQNGLLQQTIRVKLITSVVNTPGRTSQLTVGPFKNEVIVPPGQPQTVRLPVGSAPQGSTVIGLDLTSADGTPLTFAHASLTVLSTRYGRAILFLIGAAIGVLVLTSVFRGIRRRLHDDSNLVNEEADPPGSVVTGNSAPHPTEAPDDLADARRWVDDA